MPEQHALARGDFLKAFVRDRHTIGAVAPTSRGVARRMARLGGVQLAHAVAEFGPGTGAITHSLLEALPTDGHIWAFEVYPPFIEHLRRTIEDPRFTLLERSAAEVEAVRAAETPAGFDAVISSIPFSLLGPALTAEIVGAVAHSLRPGGTFVALQYHPTFLAPFLRARFKQVRRSVYPWNLPPTLLLTARGALDSRQA